VDLATIDKIEYIEWVDSCHHTSGWFMLNEIDYAFEDPLLTCKSVGFVIYEDDHKVILAADLMYEDRENEQVSRRMTIPKVAIKFRFSFDIGGFQR
jgi:hypothetical protein